MNRHPQLRDKRATDNELASMASNLRAPRRWAPSMANIEQGRNIMLSHFQNPSNVWIAEFAKRSGKSPQHIYTDIAARRLLTLTIEDRGTKVPDWQIDKTRRALTQAVLNGAAGIDNWTIYLVLSEPVEAFLDCSPITAVRTHGVEKVAQAVFSMLGVILKNP